MARLARAGIEAKLFGQPMQQIRVGRYEVLAELGTGGMGVVYRARDPELDREVALKLLRPAGTTRHDPETARARLVREARAMARLSHPNVLTVHEVGTFEDQVFVAMEYVEGRTLAEWLAQAERPWQEVLDAFIAAGRGLAAAHDKGIVHRDFKPENAMVSDEDGRVLVLDFGLARSAEAPALDPEEPQPIDPATFDASLTLTGALVGTPAYMAPELYAGKPADERSDQFAFCVALWEAVYRQRPFVGGSLAALAQSVSEGDIRSPIGVGPRPSWLRRVLERGLAVDPRERHASMHALLDAIAEHMRPRWHQRWMPAVIGGGALAVGLVLMATASRVPQARPPRVTAVPIEGAAASTPSAARAEEPRDGAGSTDAPSAGADTGAREPDPKSGEENGSGGTELVAELTTARPQVRRQRAPRRPAYAHAWCYVREDDFARARDPSARLERSWRRDDTCFTCYEHTDHDGLRKRVNQGDCERYALCHEDTCP